VVHDEFGVLFLSRREPWHIDFNGIIF